VRRVLLTWWTLPLVAMAKVAWLSGGQRTRPRWFTRRRTSSSGLPATLPQWVLDLIDAEIDVPGLEISNRRSDFYEDDEEDDETDEEDNTMMMKVEELAAGCSNNGEERPADSVVASVGGDGETVDAVGGHSQGAGTPAVAEAGSDKARGVYDQEDLEFRATLPQWVLDLIDAEIDVPGLEISNRRSDFYEDEEKDESDEEEGELAAIAI
jgi:hypothetical protein